MRYTEILKKLAAGKRSLDILEDVPQEKEQEDSIESILQNLNIDQDIGIETDENNETSGKEDAKAFIQEFLMIEKERDETENLIYDYIDGWLEVKGEILTFNQPEKQKKRKNNNWKSGPL